MIFLHLPKTAGTSLRTALDPHFGDDEKLYLYGDLSGENLLAQRERAKRARLIYGHVSFGVHGNLAVPSCYGAMLRRPKDRIISLFHHFSRDAHSPYYEEIRNGLTLAQFIESGRSVETNNHMTRNFMTWPEAGQQFVLEREHFESAMKTIASYCCYIGLQERFRESLLRLHEIFGISSDPMVPELNCYEGEAVPFSEEDYDCIVRYNKLDIELYDTVARDWEGFQSTLNPMESLG